MLLIMFWCFRLSSIGKSLPLQTYNQSYCEYSGYKG